MRKCIVIQDHFDVQMQHAFRHKLPIVVRLYDYD